jgi:MATE family multidrug resistance protein
LGFGHSSYFLFYFFSRAMRNASLFSLLIFLAAAWLLVPIAGNQGLWIAFIVYVIARAICLGVYFPQLRRSIC